MFEYLLNLGTEEHVFMATVHQLWKFVQTFVLAYSVSEPSTAFRTHCGPNNLPPKAPPPSSGLTLSSLLSLCLPANKEEVFQVAIPRFHMVCPPFREPAGRTVNPAPNNLPPAQKNGTGARIVQTCWDSPQLKNTHLSISSRKRWATTQRSQMTRTRTRTRSRTTSTTTARTVMTTLQETSEEAHLDGRVALDVSDLRPPPNTPACCSTARVKAVSRWRPTDDTKNSVVGLKDWPITKAARRRGKSLRTWELLVKL